MTDLPPSTNSLGSATVEMEPNIVRFSAGNSIESVDSQENRESHDTLQDIGPHTPVPQVKSAPTVSGPHQRHRTVSTQSDQASVRVSTASSGLGDDVLRNCDLDFKRSSLKGTRKVRRYYRRQSDLMNNYKADSEIVQLFEAHQSSPRIVEKNGEAMKNGSDKDDPPLTQYELNEVADKAAGKRERILAQLSLIVNVVLLIAKVAAVILSGSLSIISSLVDSAVDITSGLVIWLTSRAIKNRDPYLYPRGRTRLEPIALVIISVVMAVASVQIIVQATEAIIRGNVEPDVGLDTILIMVGTIVAKALLAAACMFWGKGMPSVAVLSMDHRNDCISNTVAIACAYLAAHYWPYLDPLGAILVSLYIAFTWFRTGYGQIVMLSGRSAKPAYINRILKICLEHDPQIQSIDTVYVYHFGTKFLVEVHVVMDRNLSLMDSHNISEPLQQKIESLPYVERAFVHVDYDTDHRPETEHKLV